MLIPPRAILHDIIGDDLIAVEEGKKASPLSISIRASALARVLTCLRDYPQLQFHQLLDIIGVDYPTRSKRFEVIYLLLSHRFNWRLIIKVQTNSYEPLPTITEVYRAADWYEREVWDLYGISFTNHPNLKRILTDYNFKGHPLRKDFPLTGYTEVTYNPEEGKVVYQPVNLHQPYRNFDFLSPWEGNWSELMRQEREAFK